MLPVLRLLEAVVNEVALFKGTLAVVTIFEAVDGVFSVLVPVTIIFVLAIVVKTIFEEVDAELVPVLPVLRLLEAEVNEVE